MTCAMKPLGCNPVRIKGMSERLILSHYENNYRGAVKRLNVHDKHHRRSQGADDPPAEPHNPRHKHVRLRHRHMGIGHSSLSKVHECLAAFAVALCIAVGSASTVAAQTATFNVKLLTPEAALKSARAALEACRAIGFQVAVAVADRSGVTQVLLRDRFAGPHTVETSMNKAWTAVTFRQDTLAFDIATSKEPRAAGARNLPRIVAIGGGVLIEASGALLGAIAVSGAPGGENDHRCAEAGVSAIRDEIEF